MRVYTRMSHQVNQIPEQPLSVLIGHQLSSVEFVQDYLQLRFDGPCLTAVTHPRVRVGQRWLEWGKPGYRDQLCDRIGKVVTRAVISEGQEVCLEFDDGACITISLSPDDYRAAEAVILDNEDQGCWVW
jgi:hypothetical protein